MSRSSNLVVNGQPAYLATPVVTAERPGPWPGVIVVHDLFGLGDDMKEQADWLAAAGYVALVPDLYHDKAVARCVKSMFAQLNAQKGRTFDEIDAARSWLAATPDCTGAVGVIGYCMGGAFALLLAAHPGWAAASVNYGQLPKNIAEAIGGACPLIASYGGRDLGLKGAADRLRTAAEQVGVTADVKEYPRARHGFMNRITAVSPLTPMLKVMGIGYDHDSAADAKRRILSFFETHLRARADDLN
ncbi:MAG: dienelactone hydrolase [Pseudonocardiales bacterium]|nr:dienelactone hydrolase [Pseudonocardiales bacterium]